MLLQFPLCAICSMMSMAKHVVKFDLCFALYHCDLEGFILWHCLIVINSQWHYFLSLALFEWFCAINYDIVGLLLWNWLCLCIESYSLNVLRNRIRQPPDLELFGVKKQKLKKLKDQMFFSPIRILACLIAYYYLYKSKHSAFIQTYCE